MTKPTKFRFYKKSMFRDDKPKQKKLKGWLLTYDKAQFGNTEPTILFEEPTKEAIESIKRYGVKAYNCEITYWPYTSPVQSYEKVLCV